LTVIDSIEDITLTSSKVLSTSIDNINDNDIRKSVSKVLDTSLDTPTDALTQRVSKALATSYSGMSEAATLSTGKALSTIYSGMLDTTRTFATTKSLTDSVAPTEIFGYTIDKYVYTELEPDLLPPQDHTGYVQLNSYYGEDYIVFEDEYSVGSRQSTFNTL
jgi:hypothetical protein